MSERLSAYTEKLSCGVVLARRREQAWCTLMLRAYHHWDFPKGVREADEEPLQTAIRELDEETGITDAVFEWGDRFIETGPYSRGKTARYYLAATSTREVAGARCRTLGPQYHRRLTDADDVVRQATECLPVCCCQPGTGMQQTFWVPRHRRRL